MFLGSARPLSISGKEILMLSPIVEIKLLKNETSYLRYLLKKKRIHQYQLTITSVQSKKDSAKRRLATLNIVIIKTLKPNYMYELYEYPINWCACVKDMQTQQESNDLINAGFTFVIYNVTVDYIKTFRENYDVLPKIKQALGMYIYYSLKIILNLYLNNELLCEKELIKLFVSICFLEIQLNIILRIIRQHILSFL
ncbi:hypothetical protein AGLY_016309 [Aphis glycines]|uniref:Uncharacterized protein n=1 Tax=Aphis glycines TaxID=307491 RepID=A0A6G0T0A6_APHGL|nr:hypothetical protein AGLY_016309 [Aphis glycines]